MLFKVRIQTGMSRPLARLALVLALAGCNDQPPNTFVRWAGPEFAVTRCYEDAHYRAFVEVDDGRIFSLATTGYAICWKGLTGGAPLARVANLRRGQALCRLDRCVEILSVV